MPQLNTLGWRGKFTGTAPRFCLSIPQYSMISYGFLWYLLHIPIVKSWKIRSFSHDFSEFPALPAQLQRRQLKDGAQERALRVQRALRGCLHAPKTLAIEVQMGIDLMTNGWGTSISGGEWCVEISIHQWPRNIWKPYATMPKKIKKISTSKLDSWSPNGCLISWVSLKYHIGTIWEVPPS